MPTAGTKERRVGLNKMRQSLDCLPLLVKPHFAEQRPHFRRGACTVNCAVFLTF